MIKYVTDSTAYEVRAKIKPVEIDRETESSVWVRGRRRAKDSEYETFHNSWAEARSHLIESAKDKVALAKMRLEHHESNLKELEALQP